MSEHQTHRMEKTIRIPQVGESYWQTACGIRLAHETEIIHTSEDRKLVTCNACLKSKR